MYTDIDGSTCFRSESKSLYPNLALLLAKPTDVLYLFSLCLLSQQCQERADNTSVVINEVSVGKGYRLVRSGGVLFKFVKYL